MTASEVYASLDSVDDAAMDDFYEKLQDAFDDIPNPDLKILIGISMPNWAAPVEDSKP